MKKPFKSGSWVADESGNLENEKDGFYITNDRLKEQDWIKYFRTFDKFNWNHFLPVYIEACERAGVKEITFKI